MFAQIEIYNQIALDITSSTRLEEGFLVVQPT